MKVQGIIGPVAYKIGPNGNYVEMKILFSTKQLKDQDKIAIPEMQGLDVTLEITKLQPKLDFTQKMNSQTDKGPQKKKP